MAVRSLSDLITQLHFDKEDLPTNNCEKNPVFSTLGGVTSVQLMMTEQMSRSHCLCLPCVGPWLPSK